MYNVTTIGTMEPLRDSSDNYMVQLSSTRSDRTVWEDINNPGNGYICHSDSEYLPGPIVCWWGGESHPTLESALTESTCWDAVAD